MIDIHAHPDHLTAMPYFKKRYGARTVTGSGMGIVLRAVRDIYNLGVDFPADGRQFNLLFISIPLKKIQRNCSHRAVSLSNHCQEPGCPFKYHICIAVVSLASCRLSAMSVEIMPLEG